MIFTRPPAFQKYLASAADPKVTVWVNVMVHGVLPDPVAVVFDVVPEKVPMVVPDAAALPREPVSVLMSVATAFRMVMVLPATGAVRAVMVVPWWLPRLAKLFTKVAHCVAVTVPATDTLEMAVWP